MNKKAEIYEWGISANGRAPGGIDYKRRGRLFRLQHEYRRMILTGRRTERN